MRSVTYVRGAGLAGMSLVAAAGCVSSLPSAAGGGGGQPGAATINFTFNDGEGLTFDVAANEPADIRLQDAQFDLGGTTITSGTVQVPPEAITVERIGGAAKAAVAMQAGEPLSVTVWIAGAGDIDTVCGGGEQYPPSPDTAFLVTLDENFIPTSVEPSSVPLTQNTVDLINGGAFTMCLRVNWSLDARVTMDSIRFELE